MMTRKLKRRISFAVSNEILAAPSRTSPTFTLPQKLGIVLQRALALSALGALALCVDPSAAYFERVQTSPRATAFGGAYSAIADDASASYYNPAALVAMPQAEVLLVFAKPHGIEGYQAAYAAAALPRDDVSLGFYWHHAGVSDIVNENLIGLSVGRDLLPAGGNIALAVGGTLKLASVSFSPDGETDYGSKTQFTFDLSTLANFTERFAVSAAIHNVVEPEFDFVAGNGGTELKRRADLGASYRWHPQSTLALALSQNALQDWRFHLGGEVWFHDVFSVRSGFVEGNFAGGIGLKSQSYLIDVAFLTNEALGASYEIALRVPFGDSRW